MKTLVVVNPNSANGETGRTWSSIRKPLIGAIGPFDESFTSSIGDATRIVHAGLLDGCERIIAVGGDGTSNEVINGFFDGQTPVNSDACLGFIPRGTGGDLRKTLGIGRKLADCIPVLERSHLRAIDVGRTSLVDHQGQTVNRYFINITSFGIGGLVDKLVNESTKSLGGKASFMIGTIRAIMAYSNKTVRLQVDDFFDETIKVNNIAVANGQYFGGGMWVAPEASPDDGLFDIVIFGDLSKFEMIKDGNKIYKGTHLKSDKIRAFRGRHVQATSEDQVLIDMDGEQPGSLPITLDVVPKAIKVIAP